MTLEFFFNFSNSIFTNWCPFITSKPVNENKNRGLIYIINIKFFALVFWLPVIAILKSGQSHFYFRSLPPWMSVRVNLNPGHNNSWHNFYNIGFLASWFLGFLASWLLGFLASRLLGFSSSRLLGLNIKLLNITENKSFGLILGHPVWPPGQIFRW